MLQNAILLRKSMPRLPNISDEHVSCAAPATQNAFFQILFICRTPAIFCGNSTNPSHFAQFWQGAQFLAPATPNGIGTSSNGLSMVGCIHFDLETRFAPQRRAIFRHLNFQKWSEHVVFCHFLLGNLLRAATECNLSSLIGPAGSAPAALASLLFDPVSRCFATFRDFSRLSNLSTRLYLLSSDFPSLIFSISYLVPSDFLHGWASSWLCLSICPYCSKFDF